MRNMSDKQTQEILASFPRWKLTKSQQIIMWLIKRKCVIGLELLFKIGR
mgnify:FL=1